MAEEDAATCTSCIFRLRFGFRRSLFETLFLKNPPLVQFVRKLGIKGDGDVARIMRVFIDVDLRGTHKLDIETFFGYFGIEFTEYNKRAFKLLAFGEQRQAPGARRGSTQGPTVRTSLSFDHFFVSMYNYGTLLHEALIRFAFDVMAAGKDFCNRRDVLGLVSLLHSDAARVKDTTASLMGIMDPHNRDRISFETFRKEERRLGSMLFPAFKLQKILRSKVLGQWFWRKATKKRRKARLVGADLRREYTKLREAHLQTMTAPSLGGTMGVAGGGGVLSQGVTADNKAGDGGVEAANDDTAAEGPLQTVPNTDDEGYRPEGDGEWGEDSSSSSSSSDGEERQQQGRRESAAGEVRGAPRRVSYAANVRRPTGSLSSSNPRRTSSFQRGAPSDSYAPSSGRRRSSVATGGGRRKLSSAALSQGSTGRRGSMFEDMKVFDPSTAAAPTGDRRRSTRKPSRAVAQDLSPVSERGYPVIQEEG